jgi:hypothetical protein
MKSQLDVQLNQMELYDLFFVPMQKTKVFQEKEFDFNYLLEHLDVHDRINQLNNIILV